MNQHTPDVPQTTSRLPSATTLCHHKVVETSMNMRYSSVSGMHGNVSDVGDNVAW